MPLINPGGYRIADLLHDVRRRVGRARGRYLEELLHRDPSDPSGMLLSRLDLHDPVRHLVSPRRDVGGAAEEQLCARIAPRQQWPHRSFGRGSEREPYKELADYPRVAARSRGRQVAPW